MIIRVGAGGFDRLWNLKGYATRSTASGKKKRKKTPIEGQVYRVGGFFHFKRALAPLPAFGKLGNVSAGKGKGGAQERV